MWDLNLLLLNKCFLCFCICVSLLCQKQVEVKKHHLKLKRIKLLFIFTFWFSHISSLNVLRHVSSQLSCQDDGSPSWFPSRSPPEGHESFRKQIGLIGLQIAAEASLRHLSEFSSLPAPLIVRPLNFLLRLV